MRPLVIVALMLLELNPAMAGGGKRPPRRLAVEFQTQHATQCAECAYRIASLLKSEAGVIETRPVKERQSAYVVFEDGGADLDRMKRVLASNGIAARIVWGPAAVEADGKFERIPIDSVPRERPTLKERREAKRLPPPKSGFVPPEEESVPTPTE